MPLSKIQYQPGINRELTSYSNEGGWFDGDHVRFRFGFPEKIGGWSKVTSQQFLGACRSLHAWTGLSGTRYLGVGTNLKFYVFIGGVFYDLTPIRATSAAGAVTFEASATTLSASIGPTDTTIPLTSTAGFPPFGRVRIGSEVLAYGEVSGSNLISVTRAIGGTTAASHTSGAAVGASLLRVLHTSHGATPGDFVTFSAATALGGTMTAGVLNQEYQIVDVEDSNTYYVYARDDDAPLCRDSSDLITGGGDACLATGVYATSSDSGSGGAAAVGEYQINVGLDSQFAGLGWGAGGWGTGPWGGPAASPTLGAGARIWSQDNFGQVLLACFRGGPVYYWNPTDGTGQRLRDITTIAGANETPTAAGRVMVSERDRHVILFGAVPEGGSTYDPMLIRFSSQESLTEWSATATTTAGDLRIGSGSRIVAAVKTRQQSVIFTDSAIYTMQFLGPPFTFGVAEQAFGTTIQGPNAAAPIEDIVFWMGKDDFFAFTGRVERLPCTVRDYVFSDFNSIQSEKVFAASNSAHSEVWWFYPSAGSDNNDRYVVYNYEQRIWYYGTMDRASWVDQGQFALPVAAGPDGYLYYHEDGFDADGVPLESFIESSELDLADGHQFAFITRMIPDVTFRNSTYDPPSVTLTVSVKDFPGQQPDDSDARSVVRSTSAPVERFTDQLFLRLRGRSFLFRVASDALGVAWRLGSPRLDIRPDGRR